MSHSYLCPNCGLHVDVPAFYTRPKIRCPECGVISEIPASARRPPPEAKPSRPSERRAKPPTPPARTPRPPSDATPKLAVPAVPPPTYAATYIWPAADDEWNSDPYAVADPERPRCPRCEAAMEHDTVVCLRCGWDRQSGRKLVREFTPLVEHWSGGLPASRRFAWFLLGQAFTLGFGLAGAWLLGEPTAFVFPWLLFTALTAFLLGTYDDLNLTRDRKGRVELTRTWHICFIPRPSVAIDLRPYEGVATGRDHEAGFFEWVVFVSLLPPVIPALLWWWVAIRQDTVYVALTRDHGYADLILYRGWNQEQARALAEKLADAARLPLK